MYADDTVIYDTTNCILKSDDRHVATCQTMSTNMEIIKWTGERNVPD